MQTSQISFDLENKSATNDVMAVLIPAILRRNGLLAGKFLKAGSFKDESGSSDVVASAESPAGALAELDEYASQLENIKVLDVCVTTDNLAQATMNFVQKTYVEFKPAVTTNIETVATLVAGQSAVLHTFKSPFLSGIMKSLEMKLLKGQKVTVCLTVELPTEDQSSPLSLPVLN